MADPLSRDELVDAIDLVLTALGDLAHETWRDTSEVPEQRQRLLEYFHQVAGPREVAARLRKGEPPLGTEIPVEADDDLMAALWVDVSTVGSAGRVQVAILIREEEELRGVCVRFESPECRWYEPEEAGGGEGIHDYHHVQLSGEIRGAGDILTGGLPVWFPTSRLAPPVAARDPIDLVLCALLAVRPPTFLRKVGGQTGSEDIVRRIDRILS